MVDIIGRSWNFQVLVNGLRVDQGNVIGVRINNAVTDPVPTCSLVIRQSAFSVFPYDAPIEIWLGSTIMPWSSQVPSAVVGVLRNAPSTTLVRRFKGRVRSPTYNPYPQLMTIQCIGTIGLAAEHFNARQPLTPGGQPVPLGGLIINNVSVHHTDQTTGQDSGLVTVLGLVNQTAPVTAAQVIIAVLSMVTGIVPGVDFVDSDIGCSGRLYDSAWPSYAMYMWGAGTPQASLSNGGVQAFVPQAGVSAVDYIRAWNQIEAVFEPDPSPPPPPGIPADKGGFYVLTQFPGGKIKCVLMGGRPRGDIDQSSDGSDLVFTEGVNVFSESSITRGYPQANRSVVRSFDMGAQDYGPMFYEVVIPNPYMPTSAFRYDPNPPNSNMIMWPNLAVAQRATAANYPSLSGVVGMDAQTVASARMLELSRIEVTGSIETIEDYSMGQAQTVLVQGAGGQAARLGTGEKVWTQTWSLDFHLGPMGEPIFRMRFDVKGGGAPDNTLPAQSAT